MNWLIVGELVLKYGLTVLPFAEKLWKLAIAGLPPTDADWVELKALAAQTAKSQMTDALGRAGIDLNHPYAKALLALTGKG